MRFDCIPKPKKPRARDEWHVWFAWHPIKITNEDCRDFDCRWLETVLRCRYVVQTDWLPVVEWRYKPLDFFKKYKV